MLCKFLCGVAQWSHPLAKVDVLSQMQQLVTDRCVDVIKTAKVVEREGGDVDLADGLGPGDPTTAPAGKRMRFISKKNWVLVPPAMHVPMPLLGSEPGWAPLVAPQLHSQLVRLEINEKNLRNLYAVVSHELSSKAPAEPMPKDDAPRLGKEPRGDRASREYHIASKGWVRCIKHDQPDEVRAPRRFKRVAPKRKTPTTPMRRRRKPEAIGDESPQSLAGVTFEMDEGFI